jgi:glyoxylase-like metal-dependent hydrolase (beta-lactamase superfamily II)
MTYDVITLPVGPLETNCYLLAAHDDGRAVCIDPGADSKDIIAAVRDRKLVVEAIVLTHGHGDHIGAVGKVRSAWDVPVYVHPGDAHMLPSAEANLSAMIGLHTSTHDAEHMVEHGASIPFADTALTVLHTPGHTPGGISLYLAGDAPVVFSGDALFRREIGRCDLPGGSFDQLCASIKTHLYALPDKTIVYPGHGPSTTIGEERRENPYVTAP